MVDGEAVREADRTGLMGRVSAGSSGREGDAVKSHTRTRGANQTVPGEPGRRSPMTRSCYGYRIFRRMSSYWTILTRIGP